MNTLVSYSTQSNVKMNLITLTEHITIFLFYQNVFEIGQNTENGGENNLNDFNSIISFISL